MSPPFKPKAATEARLAKDKPADMSHSAYRRLKEAFN